MESASDANSTWSFQELPHLSVIDYTLFGGSIVLSLIIGLYFGFFSNQKSTKEYLFGGKNMGYVPVATSMLAGHISGITILGAPTEVYQYGGAYFLIVITIIVTCLSVTYIFLPVFYKLQLESTYEYLELRFSRRIRTIASILYIVSLVMYIPIVVYVPALAFSQVTGYSIYIITTALCSICIVYTSIGGVKAVIWTDTIQFLFTMGGLLAVFVIGLKAAGGFTNVWHIAAEGNRTEIFNMDPSPFVRKTFWGMSISLSILFMGHFGVSQNCVQRFLSIPTERDVRKGLLLLGIGMTVIKMLCALTGLNMYAQYHDCDPLQAKIIQRSDQILPYYVMDVSGHINGLPGIFLAGLVSCALSTMSAALNTLSGTIYDDFIDPWLPTSSNREVRATTIMKILAVIVGLIGMTLACFVQHLGTIFEISLSVRSIAEGPLFGLFVLGMLVPWCGEKGAFTGSIIGLIFMPFLVIGNQWYAYSRGSRHTPLPTSIDNCSFPITDIAANQSIETSLTNTHESRAFFLFQISMMHHNSIGTLITVVSGLVASLIVENFDMKTIEPDHITPMMRRFLPRTKKYAEVPLEELNK